MAKKNILIIYSLKENILEVKYSFDFRTNQILHEVILGGGARHKKCLVFLVFPNLRCLRHQAINLSLHSRYFLEGKVSWDAKIHLQ